MNGQSALVDPRSDAQSSRDYYTAPPLVARIGQL